MALTNKLTAIADAIRGKTGKSEEMTLDQMAIEIAGISSGGGGGIAYDMGEFVLDADVHNLYTNRGDGIPHELGETPDFILVWTDDFADLSSDNVNPYGTAVSCGYMWMNGLTGMVQRLTSAANLNFGMYLSLILNSSAYALSFNPPTSASYCISTETLPTSDKIGLVPLGNTSCKYKAGLTYKYFVSKAWWNVGGVANAE